MRHKILVSALVLTVVIGAGCGGKQVPTPILAPSPEPTADVGATITARIQDAEATREAVYATMTAKAQDAQRRWNAIYATATARARETKLGRGTAPTNTPQPQPKAPTPTSRLTKPPPPSRVAALVLNVIDGDTIEIEGGQRVRYIGMDTPEAGDPFFAEATEANRRLVEGRLVELEKDVSETDRFGRLLRYVYVGDTFVNAELVKQGYAQVATFPPDVKHQALFLSLQQEARTAGRGLWREPKPTNTPVPVIVPTNTPVRLVAPTATFPPLPLRKCCKICRKGKACGDSCISRRYTCHQPPGCACDG